MGLTPGAFSVDNALEILPDESRRKLGEEARRFAEEGKEPRLDFGGPINYWDAVVIEHRMIFWLDAYQKRKARLERLKEKEQYGRIPKDDRR